MWLDKLGMAASYNVSVVVRQSLIGGSYGLIDEKTLEPNAVNLFESSLLPPCLGLLTNCLVKEILLFQNYWVSYIFKKVVGPAVLKLWTSCKDSLVRLYAHCHLKSKARRNSVVIFGMNLSPSQYKGHIAIGKLNSSQVFRVEKYILMPVNGQVTSR